MTLFTKTSGNDGFIVKWLTTDKIRLVVGDGVSLTNVDVVASSGFTDGSRHTATIAWVDGVGATFSYDGVQSGNQVPAAKTLTNAAVDMTIGSATSIGKVYRMQVGSLYDMNAALAAETTINGATFTGGAGETWTLNNSGTAPAQIVGSPSFLFTGGLGGHYLKATFAWDQPAVWILVVNQLTWTSGDFIFDGNVAAETFLYQASSTPKIKTYHGAYIAENPDLFVNTWGIVSVVGNGANGRLQVNTGTAITGNAGASNPGGITLGARTDGVTPGNIQAKELIGLTAVPSAEKLLAIQQRLAKLHGIAL